MRTPSSQKCRLDLAPPWADRFILGIVPIDCSPALLLMPFGFHLAVDSEAITPHFWIWRPSFGRQRDFNPPEQRPAQRTLPTCRPFAQNLIFRSPQHHFWPRRTHICLLVCKGKNTRS